MVEIKGTVLSDTINAVKKRSGYNAYNKILELLNNGTKKIFGSNDISYSNWYPLDSMVEFLEADIKITAGGNIKEIIPRSEELIEKQLKGIYKIFIKIGSPEFVIKKITSTHKYYFKGVTIEALMTEKNQARIKYRGFKKNQYIIGYAIIGFYKKALEISGAKNIRYNNLTAIEEGKDFCELELKWDNK